MLAKMNFKLGKEKSVLPGFGITMGFTLFYLSIIVMIPLSMLFIKTFNISLKEFITTITDRNIVHAYKITFGLSFIAALVNAVFGLIVAWVLVRYKFIGKKIIDAVVDLPFAMPTAISGIALAAIYSDKGVIGKYFAEYGIQIAFTPIGITIALIFVGLPFVVRTVEPIIEDLDREIEEAAASLGATRLQCIYKIIFPQLLPSLLTGFSMAFARALGEYGSVIFIAGNIPNVSEIVPLIIVTKLEQYDYTGATSIALLMLIASFLMLLVINFLQSWNRKYKDK